MKLDLPTLAAVFVQITAVLGALLLFSWALNRQVQALAWWGAAFFSVLAGTGFVSLGDGNPTIFVLFIANSFLALGYGLLYTGCRVFNSRPVTLPAVLTGVTVWCLGFLAVLDNGTARLAFMSTIAASYSALSAWELWRHARQRLASQHIAICLLIGFVVFNVFRGTLGASLGHAFWIDGFAQRWSAPMAMAMATLMPTLAFVFLSMAKEQLEYEYRQAALVDPLTGIPNRRAFFQNAPALLLRRNAPVSCLLFDLDNFKNLNDSYGHDVGDHVLGIFGRVLSDHLPKGVFGRLGGEEFGAIVPLGKAEAEALAEAIRHSFASAGKIVRGIRVDITVSVGCATEMHSTIQELLRQADLALYQAKARGRNVVASVGIRAT